MTDNRNTSAGHCGDNRGTVCIDTNRVLDSCRDRDCFENSRVYLTAFGEGIIANSNNVRARSASVIGAYVGIDDVPFNCGFFRVTVRYYVLVELEACLGGGRGQSFKGITVLDKDVVLYGGEGNVTTFSSDPENSFCSVRNINLGSDNSPTARVETVEPIILGTKICECNCACDCNEIFDIPDSIRAELDGEIVTENNDNPRLYMSFGVFSVIRLIRPAQLLIQATDYCVPDKECFAATNDEDPCSVFKNMPFPASRFCTTTVNGNCDDNKNNHGRGSCCSNR